MVWTIFIHFDHFSIYWEFPSSQLTFMFFRGFFSTTNQTSFSIVSPAWLFFQALSFPVLSGLHFRGHLGVPSCLATSSTFLAVPRRGMAMAEVIGHGNRDGDSWMIMMIDVNTELDEIKTLCFEGLKMRHRCHSHAVGIWM